MSNALRWGWVALMAVSTFAVLVYGAEFGVTSPYPAARALQSGVVLLTSFVCLSHVYFYWPTPKIKEDST